MTAIQSVSIVGLQERTEPKPHTVYQIKVQSHVRSWQMWRRYSEFDDLHADLVAGTNSPPPAVLPPKHKFSILKTRNDPSVLEERRAGLEIYLKAIVSSKDDKWREHYAFKEFLGVPVGRKGVSANGEFTLATWLDEHSEIQARLRDVRADINKREALSDQGDINASHKSNVNAKKKLAGVLSRIGVLAKSLQDLAMKGMSEGELQRRTDMVSRLQDDCEKLNKMATVSRYSSRMGDAIGRSNPTNPAPTTDRETLFGGNTTRVTRVFGAPQQPQETEVTRPLDSYGLFGLQQLQMQQQDDQLNQLSAILRRQRYMGEAIGNEIRDQNQLLDNLSDDVDRVGDKLHTTTKQLRRLD